MSISLDRNIMKWFDELFEKKLMTLSIDDFVCSILDVKNSSKLSLNRSNKIYWTIDIILPCRYVRRLKDNVHPLFGGYIYEEASIYEDQEKYKQLNTWIRELYEEVLDYGYSEIDGSYILSYREEFLNMCENLSMGQEISLNEDLFFCPISQDLVKFTNGDESIVLNLMYSSSQGESLIDSLLDLSRSIIIRRNE